MNNICKNYSIHISHSCAKFPVKTHKLVHHSHANILHPIWNDICANKLLHFGETNFVKLQISCVSLFVFQKTLLHNCILAAVIATLFRNVATNFSLQQWNRGTYPQVGTLTRNSLKYYNGTTLRLICIMMTHSTDLDYAANYLHNGVICSGKRLHNYLKGKKKKYQTEINIYRVSGSAAVDD